MDRYHTPSRWTLEATLPDTLTILSFVIPDLLASNHDFFQMSSLRTEKKNVHTVSRTNLQNKLCSSENQVGIEQTECIRL